MFEIIIVRVHTRNMQIFKIILSKNLHIFSRISGHRMIPEWLVDFFSNTPTWPHRRQQQSACILVHLFDATNFSARCHCKLKHQQSSEAPAHLLFCHSRKMIVVEFCPNKFRWLLSKICICIEQSRNYNSKLLLLFIWIGHKPPLVSLFRCMIAYTNDKNHGLSWCEPRAANHICQSRRGWWGTKE